MLPRQDLYGYKNMGAETALLEMVRTGMPLSWRQRLSLIVRLSVPSMLAQLSYIVMVYIDASMVGSLGAEASAAIGLMSTSTWLFGGILSAASVGFSVQVAHLIGAGEFSRARDVLRQALAATSVFGLGAMCVACAVSPFLPGWLGGDESITGMASEYFLIFALSLPFMQLNRLSGSMLQSSGNMKVPSLLNVFMCILDVIFNTIFIFPTREISVLGLRFTMYGAGMEVAGAALGTALAIAVTSCIMSSYLCFRSRELSLTQEKSRLRMQGSTLKKAFQIGAPIGLEHTIMCGAQIASTVIVAPLGNIAIAANAFAVTAESLCYMPGQGIGDAATTLVGQSVGACRKDLTRRFANMSVVLGMAVMTVMGAVMYLAAPLMMGIMTPVAEIKELGVSVLRIEAFAEPMYAASIVAYCAFIGTGDTLIPSCMNFFSIWVVRLSLAAILAPVLGLKGVWIAMCIELCFRGAIFLYRLVRGRWLDRIG